MSMSDQPTGPFPIEPMPPAVGRLRILSLVVGIAFLAISAAGYAADPAHFFRSYLFAFLFWAGMTMGSLTWVMISHMTGGGWGVVNRRFGEAAFLNLPLILIFFLPLCLPVSLKSLFPWAHIADFAADPKVYAVLKNRATWYTPAMFTGRNVVCFLILIGFALVMRAGSLALDKKDNPRLRRRLRLVAAPGVLLYFIIITSYAMDLVLSRETNWYSAIIGFLMAIQQGATAMSVMVLAVCFFAKYRPLKDVLQPQHLNDLGNLLLTLVILYTYMNVAQLLVIWQGNTIEDIGYYTHRGLGIHGSYWGYVAIALLVGHFFMPFLLLLMKNLKRKTPTLARIAALILFMRVIDCLWVVAPSGPHRGGDGRVYWTDATLWLGLGGIWVFFYLLTLARKPLLPNNASGQPEILTDGPQGHAAHAV
jgi:hypothetical protein